MSERDEKGGYALNGYLENRIPKPYEIGPMKDALKYLICNQGIRSPETMVRMRIGKSWGDLGFYDELHKQHAVLSIMVAEKSVRRMKVREAKSKTKTHRETPTDFYYEPDLEQW